ncbi:MAG TPA: hypothetical protein VMT04_02355 [Terriglobales bacterium]|nr:hypothetical protein [Terriglobales bacterium]
MKLKLILITALLLLAFVDLGLSQTLWFGDQVLVTRNILDYNLIGGGARARGMGGAFIGVSDDPSAASWNPSGLTQLDKYQMGATLYFINPSLKYTTAYAGTDFANSLKQNKASISFGSVILPFKLYQKQVVGSVLYNRSSDIYDKRIYNFPGDRRIDNFGVYQITDTTITTTGVDSVRIGDKQEEIKGGLDVVNLSLATKVYKELSLGVGINIYTGSYEYNSSQQIRFTWNPAFDTLILYHPFIKGSYSGANFTIGAMYKYQDFRIGAIVKTPFKLQEKDDAKFLKDVIINGITITNPDATSSRPVFPVEYKQKWEIPFTVGFGASYAIKGLTLAGDLEFRNFSKAKLHFPRKWSDPNSPDSTMDLDWNSITQFRIGGEYVYKSKYGTIPIRAGFRNDPQVFSDLKNVDFEFVDYDPQAGHTLMNSADVIGIVSQSNGNKVTGNTFSVGTGIGWSQIKLDFTFEYSQYNTKMAGTILEKSFEIAKLEKKNTRFLVNFTGFF